MGYSLPRKQIALVEPEDMEVKKFRNHLIKNLTIKQPLNFNESRMYDRIRIKRIDRTNVRCSTSCNNQSTIDQGDTQL